MSYHLAFRLYRLCSVCCISLGRCWCCCAQDGLNLEQVNALTEEGHLNSYLGLTTALSKDRAIAMGNTQLRHFYAKLRLSETE